MTLRAGPGTGVAALARRWRPDRNPLRRTVDRVEAAVIAVLIVAFLGAAPMAALAAGQAVAWYGQRAVRADASWHQVPAVLLATAPVTAHGVQQASIQPLVPARWAAPGGTWRTGQVYAPQGARKGSTVLVWTDRSGQLTASPIRPGNVVAWVVLAAALAVICAGALLATAGLLARWLFDRRRLAAWDARWAATEPQWTGRR